MISIEQIDHLLENKGAVIDSNGDKVGKVEQVFVGDSSHEPQWVTAKTGLFGHSETFIPLEKASIDGSDVRVPYDKAMIKDAPRTENKDGHLQPDEEAELYRYYGLTPGGAPQDDGGKDADAGVDSGRDSDDAGNDAGRSSEAKDAGGVHLRKYTVRENVTMSVPVEHEEVRVVQDPPSSASESGPASGANQETDADSRTNGTGNREAKSEGFGHNEYDQLSGPQSEDLEHPRGTSEQSEDTGVDADRRRDSGAEHRAADERNATPDHRSGATASSGDAGQHAQSEGFGHNEYDQLSGSQSEDLEHPRGTAEEGRDAADPTNPDVRERNEEEPLNTESHGRHAQ